MLARLIGAERVRDGVAEAIPLPDASVPAVTVADAFHWFDHPRALAEIRRVLRPEGGLGIFITAPDWSGASWAHEIGTLVSQTRPAHPHFDGPSWQESVRAAGGWSEPWEIRVTTSAPSDPERIVDHLASMSWIAAMPDDERAQVVGRMRALVAAGQTPAEMPLHVTIGLASLQR